MPRISVVVTSFNQKDLLVDALESVLTQTLAPFEVIVCDDASKDGSPEVIAEYEGRYPGVVRGICHSTNIGIARNRSSGIAAATGELITWLDGDDIFLPTKLNQEYTAYVADPDVKWVYSQVNQLNMNTGLVARRYDHPKSGYIFLAVVQSMGREPRNMLVDSSTLSEIGYFDPELSLYEDFDLLLRLAYRYKCAYCPKPGMEYHVYEKGLHKLMHSRHQNAFNRVRTNFRQLIMDASPREQRYFDALLMRLWARIELRNDLNERNYWAAIGRFLAYCRYTWVCRTT